MRIIKIDRDWYKAEQKVGDGVLAYVAKAYSKTATKAIKKLITKTWNTTN
jgi:hypothetical protein